MTHTTSCMGFMFSFCAHISFLVASLSVLFVNPSKLPHNCTMDTETFKQKREKYWPNWDIHVFILCPFFQRFSIQSFQRFSFFSNRHVKIRDPQNQGYQILFNDCGYFYHKSTKKVFFFNKNKTSFMLNIREWSVLCQF